MFRKVEWSRKKELIQIPSVGHLKYDRFKQNIKQDIFIEQNLEALSSDSDDSHNSASVINLCRYLVETYEEKFISTISRSGFNIFWSNVSS